MTVSGTTSTTVFDTNKVVDHAYRRCRLPPQAITAEMQDVARDALYLLMSDLVNRGLPLWTVEKTILPFTYGVSYVDTPVGTVDLLNTNIRTMQRIEGSYTSSSGVADNAFDGDMLTSCTQATANGSITIAGQSQMAVTTYGIATTAAGTYDFVVETSTDGVTWMTALALGPLVYEARVFRWFDVEGALPMSFYRLRAVNGTTLNVAEFYPGFNPTEIPLARLNQDDYVNFPNKTFLGRPQQFWLDRQREVPVIRLWPVPGYAQQFNQIVTWRRRYLMDVGTLNQTLDIPQRWYEGLVAMLAYRLALETPQVDPGMIGTLKGLADEALATCFFEERDSSPMKIAPNLRPYTR